MDNIINPRQYRVFGQNRKLLYTFEMNEETERDLFEKMFFLGLDSPKTKEDTMDRYFDLVRQTTMEFPSIKLNDKSMYEKTKARFIASMKENIKRTKNHKLSKEEIILLFLAAALSTGFITLSKIKNSIENTGSNLDARNTAIANITEVLKENNIVEEVVIGKKGDLKIKKDADFSTVTTEDITIEEVFGYISFINDMYDDANVRRNFINSFIQVQTYNNGNNYYIDFNDYLIQNGFNSEKEFYDYCYNNENSIKIIRSM